MKQEKKEKREKVIPIVVLLETPWLQAYFEFSASITNVMSFSKEPDSNETYFLMMSPSSKSTGLTCIVLIGNNMVSSWVE